MVDGAVIPMIRIALAFLILPLVAVANLSGTDYRETITHAGCDVHLTSLADLIAEIAGDNFDGAGEDVYCFDTGVSYEGIGIVTLASSGASGDPNVLCSTSDGLTCDSSTHPYDDADKATFRGLIITGDYWDIDGITIDGNSTTVVAIEVGGTNESYVTAATNVRINRTYIHHFDKSGVDFWKDSDDGLVQESVIATSTDVSTDTFGVRLRVPGGDTQEISGIRIYHNEIFDVGDCVQYVSSGATTNTTYPDGEISGNHCYVTTARYTDCAGNYNSTGPCSDTENALDIKSGGTSSSDYVKVMDNIMNGYLRTDPTISSSSQGPAITTTSGNISDYVLFRFNIITDSASAIRTAAANNNLSFVDNIIYDIDDPGEGDDTFGVNILASDSELYRNTIIDVIDSNAGDIARGIDFGNPDTNDFKCNVHINADGRSYGTKTDFEADYNMRYNSTQVADPGTNDYELTAIKSYELCYTAKPLTDPTEVCIPYGGYRNNICGEDFTSRSGIGVHNLDWTLGPNN